ncbi:hypothetical protein Ancab_014002 [Ancistrocladus abbreviatus]
MAGNHREKMCYARRLEDENGGGLPRKETGISFIAPEIFFGSVLWVLAQRGEIAHCRYCVFFDVIEYPFLRLFRSFTVASFPSSFIIVQFVGEVGELSEIFQWKGEVPRGLPGWSEEEKLHLGEELSDVLLYLVRLSDICGVDLGEAALRKLELNAIKYPVNLCKGSSRKHTQINIDSSSTTDLNIINDEPRENP